jgi:hypothetical protein
MEIKYYPDENTVRKAIQDDDPLLMLVSFDRKEILLSNIDDAVEHNILLKKMKYSETDIDKYFRVVINQDGADWTFVCPAGYKNIEDKNRRIKTFYIDGIEAITEAIKFIGYNVGINIPKRYIRHMEFMKDNGTGENP